MRASLIALLDLPNPEPCSCGGEQVYILGSGGGRIYLQCLRCRKVTELPEEPA